MRHYTVMYSTDPKLTKGFLAKASYDGPWVIRRLVVEGLAELRIAGIVGGERAALQWCEELEEAIMDPHSPIVDGDVRPLCLN